MGVFHWSHLDLLLYMMSLFADCKCPLLYRLLVMIESDLGFTESLVMRLMSDGENTPVTELMVVLSVK